MEELERFEGASIAQARQIRCSVFCPFRSQAGDQRARQLNGKVANSASESGERGFEEFDQCVNRIHILYGHRAEQMNSAAQNPLKGDKAASSERASIVNMVDDKFHDFWREE